MKIKSSFFKIAAKKLLLLLVAVVFLYISDIGCIWRFAIHFPCPSCGMTRALLSLLRWDWQGYVHYNAMAFPVFVAAILLLFLKQLPHKKFLFSTSLAILLANLAYYIWRLASSTI